MQRRVNVQISLGCPRCAAELWVDLEDVYEEKTIRCATCLTQIPLSPDDLGAPSAAGSSAEAWDFSMLG